MCGIVGIVAAPGGSPPPEAVGHAMNAAITHRGPDDGGLYRDERALLGMRRLSIIDLEGGRQPVHNEDGTLQAVFNGEIYNFRALRAELEGFGHRFYTQSDTEAIVHGYEQWGEGVFARLDGMFGLALWDTRTRTLVLARDRFGEKPLFYALDTSGAAAEHRLVFASELKSLLQVPGLRRRVSAEAVRAYVCFGYVPTPGSIFEGVHKLPPGHYARFADGKLAVERYYRLDLEPKSTLSEADAEHELAHLLDRAVSSRLVADVPFGAFLSGGLDSSVVVALMSRHLRQPVRTFSIGFHEPEYNELSDAKRVARHLGTEHEELVVAPDAVELLQSLVWYLDEPFADSSAVPTFLVAKLARERVKMVLTGDAGDEAFAGYDRYLRYLDLQRLGPLKPAAAATVAVAGALAPAAHGFRLRRIAERLRQPFPDSYLSGVALTRASVAGDLLGEAVAPSANGHYGGLDAAARAARGLEALDRCVSIDFASYLPDDVLVKLDRMAMANSLEGRAPLLDHRVVEFGVRLPPGLRVRGRRGKHLLRRVAARWLPPDVLDKRKHGFGIPLAKWFRGPLAGLAADLLGSRAFRERGLVRPAAARRFFDEHRAGRADHGEVLWLVLSLELWARRYLDTPAA
ncbi:MAG TPA: asparagine synthase (glutamine-hydrolyzing) [Polyangia bacterium]|nr:asparagine synthase (glutamine-hydrolyzing) [Polyangia bacterium]